MKEQIPYNPEILTDDWITDNIPGFDLDEKKKSLCNIIVNTKRNIGGSGQTHFTDYLLKEIISSYTNERKEVLSKKVSKNI